VIVLACLDAPNASRASLAALALAGRLGAQAQVLALAVGGSSAVVGLEKAKTCPWVRRAIHFDEPALADADFLTLGMVLAEAARNLRAQLVLAGERSDDEGQGLVPAAIAHHLRAPLLARVRDLHLASESAVEVTLRAGGLLCKVHSNVPLVITTPPRRDTSPSALSAEPAREPAIERLTLKDIGVEPSRVVPRPPILGAIEASAAVPGHLDPVEEAARILFKRA
jgi:electron transfer flavoprotein beta subunit